MPHPDLAVYIREQTQQGVSAAALRETLMESGWREVDIENAFHDVAAGLSPVTMGASIHEDLAQVRGMVAHLAGRVRTVEAQLTSAGLLPMQGELSGGSLAPEHALAAPQLHWGRFMLWLLGVSAILMLGGFQLMRLVATGALSVPMALVIPSGVAAGMALAGFFAIRARKLGAAIVWWASAIGSWAVVAGVAWRGAHILEWTTALALGVLLIVLAGVVGRRLPYAH